MDTLLAPGDLHALWAVMLGGVALSVVLEQRYAWASKLSGPVIALLIAMLLSNVGVMPTASPAYDVVGDWLVPLAIPLLLMRANVFHIVRATGSTFVCFHVAVLGTVVGAFVAYALLGSRIESPAEVIAIMTGSYAGGSVNFAALKESYDVAEELTNPLIVADNFVMAGMFVALLMLSGSKLVGRFLKTKHDSEGGDGAATAAADHWQRKSIGLRDIALAVGIGALVVALANAGAEFAGARVDSGVARALLGNVFVWITAISLGLATLGHGFVAKIEGAEELGTYLLYVYLFSIGLPADLGEVLGNVPILFVLCIVMAVTNLIVTLTVGSLLRLDRAELLLSVNATLGGAPSAVAMAIAKGWPRLVLPGLLVGIWGYVIGTALGVLVGEALR